MSKRVYDTRFLAEAMYSKDHAFQKRAEAEKRTRERYISTVALHELYRLTLMREGRETAKLRISLLKKTFKVIPVDEQIAELSAELRQKYQLSMGDSMIAATAVMLNAICVSDDPHFKPIKEIHTTWV
ncbi:MAG TPA: PIN domain-containing protein [Candidatus Deferrimicrobiaceae bacterium]|nr:PIN domain-containing protein [Candidatus Deferrimicrobiaceae bacterium]